MYPVYLEGHSSDISVHGLPQSGTATQRAAGLLPRLHPISAHPQERRQAVPHGQDHSVPPHRPHGVRGELNFDLRPFNGESSEICSASYSVSHGWGQRLSKLWPLWESRSITIDWQWRYVFIWSYMYAHWLLYMYVHVYTCIYVHNTLSTYTYIHVRMYVHVYRL